MSTCRSPLTTHLALYRRSAASACARIAAVGLAFLAGPPALVLLGACDSPAPEGARTADGQLGEAALLLTQCVTVQRTTGGTVADAMLSFPPGSKNYGTHELLRTGKHDESLIQFDLSWIPSGAVINSATLKLFVNGATGDTVKVYAATAAWTESTVTFDNFGQHFDPTVFGVIQPSSPNALKNVNITPLVADWALGVRVNYGVLLRGSSNPPTHFWSSDSAKPALKPALEVCYTTPDNHCDPDLCQNGSTCINNATGYTCDCAPGWTGTNCQTQIDECEGNPCVHGECTDGLANYTCACQPGWTGTNCEMDIDECAPAPCANGVCQNDIASYSCTCSPGFSGTNCDVNIDECAGDPCLHGGSCADGVAGYTCACAPGFTGANCEEDIDDCVGSSCQNGGACVDGITTYTCFCPPGFTGAFCEVDIDECTGAPCLNSGVCTDGTNGYTCACAPGYSGVNCEVDINDCVPNPCQNAGLCVDGVNAFTCACPDGFTGAICETPVPVGPCAPSPCQNGGVCVDGGTSYTCQCQNGWTGTNCAVFNSGDPHGALAPAIADVDHDGKPDVLIANAESGSASTPSGSISVLLGNGDGSLQAETNYVGAPLSSNAVAAADVDGDGWVDAITVNGQTNLGAVDGSISVYLNGGASAPGQFGSSATFTTGAPASVHLCAADFNGDGAIDIATTSVSNQVSVLLGDGDGGFGAPQLISILATGGVQSTIGAADFNGDGRNDLVVTSPSSARLSILLNQGGVSFAGPVAYANNRSGQTAGLAFGDFDGDGTLDIVSNGAAGLYLFFFRGHGDGTFSTGASSSVAASAATNSALGVVAGDFNGDGRLDAYVLRSASAGGIYPMRGNGDGTFAVGTLVPTGSSPGLNAIASGDFDSDGHPDVVVTNRSSATVSVIMNSL